ncbi:MAG: TetR/AcrR family transcriptional regulator [Hyphomicrobiales bacterium]|nr:TetR/AcrR family transcriptional regulator [Hyphomicrobiales bacterium]
MKDGPASATSPDPGAPKPSEIDSAKGRQILDGARKVFLADGFDGASMNDIARVAGVSKGTIYSYFASKEALFEALVREDRRVQAEQLGAYDDHQGPVAEVMRRMGFGLMKVMLDPAHVAQTRTVIAAAAKFPGIGRVFYEAGPQFGQDQFSAWLRRKVDEGQLTIDDFDGAAAQFLNLVQGVHFRQMLFCFSPRPSDAAIERTVDDAVAVFLTVYGRKSG